MIPPYRCSVVGGIASQQHPAQSSPLLFPGNDSAWPANHDGWHLALSLVERSFQVGNIGANALQVGIDRQRLTEALEGLLQVA